MRVPVNFSGGTYQHKSRPLTNQLTRNFWPQTQGTQKARSDYILQSFYGLKPFMIASGTANRGMVQNQDKLYKITDTTLLQISSAGVATSLGTIAGTGRCMMRALGTQVIIINGSGLAYVWDGTTLTQNTSPNINTPRGVAVMNNQAITDSGTGQIFWISNVGTALTINGLNYGTAESYSDDLLIPYAWRDTLYLMGKESIELWYNSGQGNPPFDKIQGAAIKMGLGAIHSCADTPDYLIFLGNDRQFHALTPGSSTTDSVVSTFAMAKELQGYAVVDDCLAWAMELEGQWFYVATFPTQNVTWCFPIGGEWFQWGSGITGRIRADSCVQVFNKTLVAEYNSGSIYELDPETYTDAGEAIIRIRQTAPIHSGLIGTDNKEFEINSLELVLETGIGLVSGQGQDPRIAISTSRDGGETFSTERFLRAGRLGERIRIRTGSLGRFPQSCVLQIRVSDPIYWAIYSADVDMEICI